MISLEYGDLNPLWAYHYHQCITLSFSIGLNRVTIIYLLYFLKVKEVLLAIMPKTLGINQNRPQKLGYVFILDLKKTTQNRERLGKRPDRVVLFSTHFLTSLVIKNLRNFQRVLCLL